MLSTCLFYGIIRVWKTITYINGDIMNRMTVRDIDEERFFKIPKVLNEDVYYEDLPVVARYLYGVMLDRFKLSKSRKWVNNKGEVYFIFKQKDLAELLNVSLSSIKRSIVQLIEHLLIESEATLTVNRYYISFPMPKTTGQIDPTLANIDPTNGSNRANNSDTDYRDTNISETEYLHHSLNDGCSLFKILEEYSLKTFGKKLRKHKRIYDLEIFDYMDSEDFTEFLGENILKYEWCNLDYLQEIQFRAM